ncbi:hypothetical protein BX616_003321, partial [Lobosporangium transversale]
LTDFWQVHQPFAACGHAMASIIREIFGPAARVTIHLDGSRCVEKARAYEDRYAKRVKADEKLDTLITNMEANDGDKVALLAPFGQYGFTVCPCQSEADVCIAKSCEFFVQRRHHKYALYEKDEVLHALKFRHDAQLLVYGTVSDNDYTPNIPTFGLTTNADII